MSFILTWALLLIPSLILLQTLFFKFAAAEESTYILSTLAVKLRGRIGNGVVGLIAGCLLLYRPSDKLVGCRTDIG